MKSFGVMEKRGWGVMAIKLEGGGGSLASKWRGRGREGIERKK